MDINPFIVISKQERELSQVLTVQSLLIGGGGGGGRIRIGEVMQCSVECGTILHATSKFWIAGNWITESQFSGEFVYNFL